MRHALFVLMLAAATPLSRACKRTGFASPGRAAAHPAGRPRVRVPTALLPPRAPTNNAPYIDVPLAWLYLPEDPVPTGQAPDVLVGAVLPCDYQPRFGSVGAPESPLAVRLGAAYVGPGQPDLHRTCASPPVSVQYISLSRLRLNTFAVTDATPHGASDPPAPRVVLRVVPDDAAAPPRAARRVRRCAPDDDASCTAGGACGGIPDRPGVGVCAPPLDPYLVLGRSCPADTAEVRLTRTRPFATPAAPAPDAFRACLPSCDDAHPCQGPLQCASIEGRSVCVPQ